MYEGRSDIRQINKTQYERNYAAAMQRWETPVSQQTMQSHVSVPLSIAFVISVFCAGITAAIILLVSDILSGYLTKPINPINIWTTALVMAVWASSFLLTFLWRIGVGDQLLWKFEEATGEDIDGDGAIGNPYAPRAVPLNRRSGTVDLPLPEKAGGLEYAEWQQVAIALLGPSLGNVSRRGIYNNSELSQAKSSEAAKYLEGGYAVNGELNRAGFDWLLSHLPDSVQCHLPTPSE